MPLPTDMSLLCFGHRSRRTARAVTRAFNARLRPLNIQITQYILLGAVAQDPDRSMAALADDMDLESSALSRNLSLLVERGLLSGPQGRGRNGRRLTITPQGVDLLEAGVPIWMQIQADLTVALDGRADETRAALTALETAALNFERIGQ